MGGRGASSGISKRLPNYKNAIIPKDKIGNYLLNPSNKNNQGKAKLFNNIGYNMQNKQRLKEDLLNGIKRNKAILQKENKGIKTYKVDIELGLNKKIQFKTVWQVENKETKFITAMPKERK